jgi:hypothetical protein
MAEIGFWLLIVSIFIGGGIAYYYATRGTAYEVKAAQAVQDLQTAAMACWLPRGHTTFEGLSIEVLRDDGCLAAGFSGTGSNPWGGDYSVGPDPADATRLRIVLTRVPDEAGESLERRFEKSSYSASYDSGARTFTVIF